MLDFDFGQSLENGLSKVFEYLPQVIGAVLLLVVGYIIAKVAKRVTKKALSKLKFDQTIASSPVGIIITKVVDSPARFLSKTAFWLVWLAFISFAVSALSVPALTLFVAGLYSYVPNVIASIVIFLIASTVSAGSARFMEKVLGNTPTSNILRTVTPSIVMSIAVFMILNQLGIAKDIVNITYLAIMGSLSLGLALSFGLGGRSLAAQILEDAYSNSKHKLSKNELKQVKRVAKNKFKDQTITTQAQDIEQR